MGQTFSTSSGDSGEPQSSQSDATPLQFGSSRHVPKHLRPIKPNKKLQMKMDVRRNGRGLTEEAPAREATTAAKAAQAPLHNSSPEEHDRLNHMLEQFQIKASESEHEDPEPLCGFDPLDAKPSEGKYRWCQGRRFHNVKGSRYPLPNDQTELDRLRVEYYLLRWALQEQTNQNILDALNEGCTVLCSSHGPGLWLGHHIVDMALDFEKSQFICLDICHLLPEETSPYLVVETIQSPMTSNEKTKPPDTQVNEGALTTILQSHPHFTNMHPALSSMLQNTDPQGTGSGGRARYSKRFSNVSSLLSLPEDDTSEKLFDNLTFQPRTHPRQRLPYPDNTFDVVFQSQATLACTVDDWEWCLSELIRVTKPGGYIQLIEADTHMYQKDAKAEKWQEIVFEDTIRQLGIEPRIARYLDEMLERTGWTNVSTRFVSIPVGDWGLDIGILWQQNVHMFMAAMEPCLVHLWQDKAEKYRDQWRAAQKKLNSDRRGFHNVHIAWAQKSPDGSVVSLVNRLPRRWEQHTKAEA